MTDTADEAAARVASATRVGVLVLAARARSDLAAALRRIPAALRARLASICVVADSFTAPTDSLRELQEEHPQLVVLKSSRSRGYGGDQKTGYAHAARLGLDVVVLLPIDAPHAPELLPRVLAPFEDAGVDAVFGSRLLGESRGRMPAYKRFGNRVLTRIENRLLGSSITDRYSGYRAYRVTALADLPYRYNTNGLHFDTEIGIQLDTRHKRIVEVPIPEHSGGEVRGLAAIRHAVASILTVVRSLANRVYLVYHPKFDLEDDASYVFKEAPNSLHQYVLRRAPRRAGILELGAGHGQVGLALHASGAKMVAIDAQRPRREFPFPYLERDLDQPFADAVLAARGEPLDAVIALDVIEHLKNPEVSLREIHRLLAPGATLIASTGNVAYVLMRIMLLAGQFNYGKKGILDLTHKRLFTIRSFRRTLAGEGFDVRTVRGFGPPIVDMVGRGRLLRALDRVAGALARVWPSLFSYQFLVEATRREEPEETLASALSRETAD